MKFKFLLFSLILVLAGCGGKANYVSPSSSEDGVNVATRHTGLTQRSARRIAEVEQTEYSRRACYDAIVDIEKAKANAMKPLFDFINSPGRSEMAQIVGLQMLQTNQIISALINQRQEAPIQCKQMGIHEYKLAMSQNRWGNATSFGKSVLKFGVIGFGIDKAFDLGSLAINKLSEPKIQSGPNSTNILGNENDYSPDNSVREGVCIGEVAEDGTCVQPLPEEESESAGEEVTEETPIESAER